MADSNKKIVCIEQLQRALSGVIRLHDQDITDVSEAAVEAIKAVSALDSEIDQRLDNKSFRFVTQEEYDNLSEEDLNEENIVWCIEDELGSSFIQDVLTKEIEELNTSNKTVASSINELDDNIPKVISEEVIFEVTKEELEAAWNANPTIGGDSSTYIEMPLIEITDSEIDKFDYIVYSNGKEYTPNSISKNDYDGFTRSEIEFYSIYNEETNINGGYYGSHYDINWNDSQTTGILKIDRIDRDKPPIFTSDLKLIRRIVKKVDNKFLENNLAIKNSISVGIYSNAQGEGSAAFGASDALAYASFAEGLSTASGSCSHSEGTRTIASGQNSHAEGNFSEALGESSHSEGDHTTASGRYSHAEGNFSIASGQRSHAEGYGTIASKENQHAQGKYNIEDTENKYAHIVGNGTANARSNAHTLDWSGNAWFQGNVSIDGTPTNDKDLTTKDYVDKKLEIVDALTLNGYSLWVGTTEELEAIIERDPNTLYFEIDDNTGEEVVQVDIVDGILQLTDDKYQKTNMLDGTTIVFPAVNKFTEIHLYFTAESNISLNFPDNCRWRIEPNIEEGKSYEIIATYNTIEWLVNVIVYS